jgi:hypothetical protein
MLFWAELRQPMAAPPLLVGLYPCFQECRVTQKMLFDVTLAKTILLSI